MKKNERWSSVFIRCGSIPNQLCCCRKFRCPAGSSGGQESRSSTEQRDVFLVSNGRSLNVGPRAVMGHKWMDLGQPHSPKRGGLDPDRTLLDLGVFVSAHRLWLQMDI